MKLAWTSYTGQRKERYIEKIYLDLNLVVEFYHQCLSTESTLFRLSEYNLPPATLQSSNTLKNINFDNTGLSNFLKTYEFS